MNKEIIIPVQELKAALPGLSKIVGRSRTLPVLQSVRVARDAEGKVSHHGNRPGCLRHLHRQGTAIRAAVEMLVPFDQLTKTAKGMKSEGTITLSLTAKTK